MATGSADDAAAFQAAVRGTRDALEAFLEREQPALMQVVEYLYGCRGKVVTSGVGKCAFIAMKIAATFTSTGTRAIFVHPTEALHGDLGLVDPDDAVLILSNSGETAEISNFTPVLNQMPVRIVALTGRPESTLGMASDAVINTAVERESDPLQLAPTASTSVMLAAGDALAGVLALRRQFTKDDYARFHPGGSLGQQLLRTVETLMHSGGDLPRVTEEMPIRTAIYEISSKRLGAAVVTNAEGDLLGILTDGDLRRLFERESQPLEIRVGAVMSRRPRVIQSGKLGAEALRVMEENLITCLPVLDGRKRVVGLLHLHDLLRAGIG